MSGRNDVGKTWHDFPDFYNSAFVHELAGNEKWTVSDKDKRPIDMRALIERGKVWGVAYNRGYNPLVDLETLKETIPNATNNAYYLEADTDKYVVLDIEPKCPDLIKRELLKLPYLYGETSMSGKGIHLVFALPENIWSAYPVIHNKLAIKEKHGYYEILLNHMVTFTRNCIGDVYDPKSVSEFEKVFETLAAEAKETSELAKEINVTEINTDDIPSYNRILSVLTAQTYKKKPSDFYDDMSKYEFGMASFYYHMLQKLLKGDHFKNVEYTDEQCAVIVYSLLCKKLEYRAKHDTQRNNMPWLMYIATQLIGKTDINKNND